MDDHKVIISLWITNFETHQLKIKLSIDRMELVFSIQSKQHIRYRYQKIGGEQSQLGMHHVLGTLGARLSFELAVNTEQQKIRGWQIIAHSPCIFTQRRV